MTEPLVVPPREAGRRIGIGRDAVYQAIREGRLKALSVGRRLYVPVAELERFVQREAG